MSGDYEGAPYLPIYLNDHLAGASVGVELARRVHASNQDSDTMAGALRRIQAEIEDDRKTLEEILERLGVSPSPVKPAGAWLLEKGARLKPNGHLRSYSPLSRVLELEGLAMGITGKLDLWRTLGALNLDGQAGVDFDGLATRAKEQRSAIKDLHQIAVAAIDPNHEGAVL